MKKLKTKLVTEVEFELPVGKCLIVATGSDLGLERVIIKNEKGVVKVQAHGHSRFEFGAEKFGPNACDFWITNRKWIHTLEDYLDHRFWGQFTWGGLVANLHNRKMKSAVREEVKKLAKEFEASAARRLSAIEKKLSK